MFSGGRGGLGFLSSLLNENDVLRVRFNVDVKSMNIEFIDRDGRCFQGLKLACQKRVAFYDSLPRWFIVHDFLVEYLSTHCHASSFCAGKDCHLKSQISSFSISEQSSNHIRPWRCLSSDCSVACSSLLYPILP